METLINQEQTLYADFEFLGYYQTRFANLCRIDAKYRILMT